MEDIDAETDGDDALEEDTENASSIGDDGDDSNNEEEDVALRKKIEEALLVNGIEAATGETDDEEELMDDDQMMAIDQELAAAFRSRANEKKTGKGQYLYPLYKTDVNVPLRYRCAARSDAFQKSCAGPSRHLREESTYESSSPSSDFSSHGPNNR